MALRITDLTQLFGFGFMATNDKSGNARIFINKEAGLKVLVEYGRFGTYVCGYSTATGKNLFILNSVAELSGIL